MKSDLKSKIFGCLLGGAIGNAFGSPFENMHYLEIEKKYGNRLIEDILYPGCIETEDDCNVTLVLSSTYINKGKRINSFDYCEGWLKYLDPSSLYLCCQNSYNLMKIGISPQVTGSLNLDTGAALMAITPAGIYNACDPDQAYIDAIELTEIYARGIDVEVAAVFAAAIAESMRRDATIDSILNIILEKTPNKIIRTYGNLKEVNLHEQVEKAIDIASRYDDFYKAREVLYDNFQTDWHSIDPVEFFIFTISIFVLARGDVDRGIVWGANIGRDADSIANLNGALAGALNGVEKIPRRLIDQVGSAYYDKYEKISDDFIKLIKKKLENTIKINKEIRDLFG
ncbi:MAG: ADP-ribosylglycohydrolase family protein [Actinobacteria bacterium]|nr:ADP-ribosylglycohydrolase family protein [Actinomycetota bacterium]